MQIRCLIVDDEPLAVDLLNAFIEKVPFLVLEGKFHDPIEAMKYLEGNETDVVFLDINMPAVSGLEFSVILPKRAKVVFTTAYREYALDSYERNTLDYLLKPITFERFLKSAEKIKAAFEPEGTAKNNSLPDEQVLFVKTGKKFLQIDLRDVTHIEGMKDYAVFHYKNQKILVGKRLKELEKILPGFFQRIHLSFFVNINHITRIEDNHVFLGTIVVGISNKYRLVFFEKINRKTL